MFKTLIYPFWSRTDRRYRTLWRIILHAILWLLLSFALIIPISFGLGIISGTLSMSETEPWFMALGGFVQIFSMLIALYLSARWLDNRRSIADYGLQMTGAWWRDLGFGLALGVILQAGIFTIQYLLGWVTITETFFVAGERSFAIQFVYASILFLSVGIYEELLSRGYHMRNISEGLRFLNPRNAVIAAWVISSVIFGVLHATNPNASFISTLNISLAGLFLGLPVLLTGRLGAAIGLHITWNFTMNTIFGFPVSGLDTTVSIFAIEQRGPDLWTGGAFGPEAGILGLLAILIGSGLILLWTRFNGEPITIYTEYANHVPRKGKAKNEEQEEI